MKCRIPYETGNRKGLEGIIICDNCSNQISLQPVDIKVTNIKIKGEELIMRFFTCPHCETLYKICLFTYPLYILNNEDKLKHKSEIIELNKKYNGKFTYDKVTKQIYYHECNMDKRKEE